MIPDTLDLLTISVRAGLGFDAALGKVVEKLKGPLSDEFRRALAEVRVGKARRDALRDIVPRTEVAPLTNFIGAIIQAEQLGVSISKVLQVQSEQLRIERRQRAEELAAKAPIKMLFPLVGCIFPSLFIVILGPAIILIVAEPGPASRPTTRSARRSAPSNLTRAIRILRDLPGGRRFVVGQVHGPDGPLLAARRRRGCGCPTSNGIHMMFMRFPIDAVFVGRPEDGDAASGRSLSVHRGLRAWTGLVPLVRGAHGVLELPVGTIEASGTAVGDLIRLATG